MWLGLLGRRKIAALEAQVAELEKALHDLAQDFRTLDVEMTANVDRLTGLAKRMQGRKGGRPPAQPQPNGAAEGDSEPESAIGPHGFSRHVL